MLRFVQRMAAVCVEPRVFGADCGGLPVKFPGMEGHTNEISAFEQRGSEHRNSGVDDWVQHRLFGHE